MILSQDNINSLFYHVFGKQMKLCYSKMQPQNEKHETQFAMLPLITK